MNEEEMELAELAAELWARETIAEFDEEWEPEELPPVILGDTDQTEA